MLLELLLLHTLFMAKRRKIKKKKPSPIIQILNICKAYPDLVIRSETKNDNYYVVLRIKPTETSIAYDVKLVASKETRLQKIMESEGCTLTKAQAMMDKSDRDRAGFCIFHYNEDWYAANSYDVVVKTDTMTIDTLAAFLQCAMASIMTQERNVQGAEFQ